MLLHWSNTEIWIPLTLLSSSLLGSGHCVAMCGGLMTALCPDRASVMRYHSGRLIGYITLGALAGQIGKQLYSVAAAIGIAIIFILLGIRLIQRQPLHLFTLPRSMWTHFSKAGPGVSGALSAFLPCGWLHSFVIAAIGLASPLKGAAFLAIFWLGTLPALSLAPWLVQKLFRPLSQRSPQLAGLILIVLGLATLAMRIVPNSSTHSHHGAHGPSTHEGGHHPPVTL